MKNIFSKTAITLIELIISTMLVSVVFFGLFSISSVLSNNTKDYAQRFLLNSQTQAVLTHILNNASLGVGSGITNDQGILIGAGGVGDQYSFCIHQQPNGVDTWLCYTWKHNIGNKYQINYCNRVYNAAGANRGAGSCNAGTLLGTSYNNPAATATYVNGVFTVTLQNCLTNSAGTCKATGISIDPVNNPEVVKTGSVVCLQQGNG